MIIQSRRKIVILNGLITFLKIKNLIYIHILLKSIWQINKRLLSISIYCIKIDNLLGTENVSLERKKNDIRFMTDREELAHASFKLLWCLNSFDSH